MAGAVCSQNSDETVSCSCPTGYYGDGTAVGTGCRGTRYSTVLVQNLRNIIFHCLAQKLHVQKRDFQKTIFVPSILLFL